jgi:hypothetical protein
MSGNFTPAQKQIVNDNCQIDVQNFNNTSSDEDPVNHRIENEIDTQYWFPNNGRPNSSNSIFCSQSEFIDALIYFPFGTGRIEELRR